MYIFILLLVFLGTPKQNELPTNDGGILKFYDTDCYGSDGTNCDIVVEKYKDSVLEWKTVIGGNSWDYAEDVIEITDGYLVLGNTGSFGAGNNDVYLTKLDLDGKELWAKTYGGFFNDYGRTISSAADSSEGYIIRGETQVCRTENVSNDCQMNELFIRVDALGNRM